MKNNIEYYGNDCSYSIIQCDGYVDVYAYFKTFGWGYRYKDPIHIVKEKEIKKLSSKKHSDISKIIDLIKPKQLKLF